jgi:hypothetical protein
MTNHKVACSTITTFPNISEQGQEIFDSSVVAELLSIHNCLNLRLFVPLHVVDIFINGIKGEQTAEGGFFLLSNAEDSTKGLLFNGSVPPDIDNDCSENY